MCNHIGRASGKKEILYQILVASLTKICKSVDESRCLTVLLCPKDPPTRHQHGDPAEHDADGGASRGEWDPLVGEEGVEGE